jgi:hypothetical protein
MNFDECGAEEIADSGFRVHRKRFHQQTVPQALVKKNFMRMIGYHFEFKDRNNICRQMVNIEL